MILLASSSQEMLTCWKQGVCDFDQIFCAGDLASLRDSLVQAKPPILLLDHDLPELEGMTGIADLVRLSPETRVIVLSLALSEHDEWELFRTGVRGCCQKDADPKQIKRIVAAVQQGELWIRRTVTCRLLAELELIALEKRQIKQAASDLLSNLTLRESEIATLVGNGESNKQIALRLAITERTVKAHLTEIFRKLNVADRLKLALLVTGSTGTRDQM